MIRQSPGAQEYVSRGDLDRNWGLICSVHLGALEGGKECASWGLRQLISDSDLPLLSLRPTQLIPFLRPGILSLLSSQSCMPEALNKCCWWSELGGRSAPRPLLFL